MNPPIGLRPGHFKLEGMEFLKRIGLQVYLIYGCMLFEESILSVECKKIYSHQMSQMNYENHEFHSMIKDKGSDHKMYIAEIIDIWVND